MSNHTSRDDRPDKSAGKGGASSSTSPPDKARRSRWIDFGVVLIVIGALLFALHAPILDFLVRERLAGSIPDSGGAVVTTFNRVLNRWELESLEDEVEDLIGVLEEIAAKLEAEAPWTFDMHVAAWQNTFDVSGTGTPTSANTFLDEAQAMSADFRGVIAGRAYRVDRVGEPRFHHTESTSTLRFASPRLTFETPRVPGQMFSLIDRYDINAEGELENTYRMLIVGDSMDFYDSPQLWIGHPMSLFLTDGAIQKFAKSHLKSIQNRYADSFFPPTGAPSTYNVEPGRSVGFMDYDSRSILSFNGQQQLFPADLDFVSTGMIQSIRVDSNSSEPTRPSYAKGYSFVSEFISPSGTDVRYKRRQAEHTYTNWTRLAGKPPPDSELLGQLTLEAGDRVLLGEPVGDGVHYRLTDPIVIEIADFDPQDLLGRLRTYAGEVYNGEPTTTPPSADSATPAAGTDAAEVSGTGSAMSTDVAGVD